MGRPNRHDPHIRTALGTGQGRRIHQGGAKDVLADALDDEPLNLGCLRQAGSLRTKPSDPSRVRR